MIMPSRRKLGAAALIIAGLGAFLVPFLLHSPSTQGTSSNDNNGTHAKDYTSSSVACSPSTIASGSKSTCTATVPDTTTPKLKGTVNTTVTPTGSSRNRWTQQSPWRKPWAKATRPFTYTTTQTPTMTKHTAQIAFTIMAITTLPAPRARKSTTRTRPAPNLIYFPIFFLGSSPSLFRESWTTYLFGVRFRNTEKTVRKRELQNGQSGRQGS